MYLFGNWNYHIVVNRPRTSGTLLDFLPLSRKAFYMSIVSEFQRGSVQSYPHAGLPSYKLQIAHVLLKEAVSTYAIRLYVYNNIMIDRSS